MKRRELRLPALEATRVVGGFRRLKRRELCVRGTLKSLMGVKKRSEKNFSAFASGRAGKSPISRRVGYAWKERKGGAERGCTSLCTYIQDCSGLDACLVCPCRKTGWFAPSLLLCEKAYCDIIGRCGAFDDMIAWFEGWICSLERDLLELGFSTRKLSLV